MQKRVIFVVYANTTIINIRIKFEITPFQIGVCIYNNKVGKTKLNCTYASLECTVLKDKISKNLN